MESSFDLKWDDAVGRNRIRVEDQSDLPIAQDGCGRNPGYGAVVAVQPLDHHLPLVMHAIDDQRALAGIFALYQQQERRGLGVGAAKAQGPRHIIFGPGAIGADRRAALADQSVAAFTEAQRVSDRRLEAGDVSGYAARRLRLEAARYAATRAAAALERRSTRVAHASLMGLAGTAADSLLLPVTLTAVTGSGAGATAIPLPSLESLDALLGLAARAHPELRAAILDADAAAAEARLAARERVPMPVFSLGYKGERTAGSPGPPGVGTGNTSGFAGFIAGISVPLPLFDRRAGAVDAAEADGRRVNAETDGVRRRIARDVADAAAALVAAEAQRTALAPHLGDDARIAVRAVQASYAEGEITLVEWLDAVRAYHDAESIYATLEAEVGIRRAALARALGIPISATTAPSSPER
jgi:cobalt-zinc-cadmium efflux system outer membrane protein